VRGRPRQPWPEWIADLDEASARRDEAISALEVATKESQLLAMKIALKERAGVFSANIDTSTNLVKGIHWGSRQPIAKEGEAFVRITEEMYNLIEGQLSLQQWRLFGGAIVRIRRIE